MAEPLHAEASKQAAPERIERTGELAGEELAVLLQGAVAPTFQGGRIDPRRLTPQAILALQRTAGNQAVNSLLDRYAAARADLPRPGMPVRTAVQRFQAIPGTRSANESVIVQRQSRSEQRETPGDAATAVVDAAVGIEVERAGAAPTPAGPVPGGGAPSGAAPVEGSQSSPTIAGVNVARTIETLLAQFQHSTVTVRWDENGVHHEESVTVSPPYFINSDAPGRSHERRAAALGNRGHAGRATGTLFHEIGQQNTREVAEAPADASAAGHPSRGHGRRRHPRREVIPPSEGEVRGRGSALVGKASPEDLHTILQQAVDDDLIPHDHGGTHPDAADLRAWMEQYGIGIDCSGFVSQALNRIMAEAYGDQPPDAYHPLPVGNTSADELGSRSRRYAAVAQPADLQPGDMMHHPGHIRIITSVQQDAEGGITFTTAESSSVQDVGPTSAVWRYPHADRFAHLHRWRGEPPAGDASVICGRHVGSACWSTEVGNDATANYTRYRRLATYQQQMTSGTGASPASPPTPGQQSVQRVPSLQRNWTNADATPHTTTPDSGFATPAGGWNAGEQQVGRVRRIPIEGLSMGNHNPDLPTHERHGPTNEMADTPGAPDTADSRAIAVVPVPLSTAQPIDVLLHFHGHNIGYRERRNDGTVRDVELDNIEQQIQAAGRPMIGILPQGTRGSGFGGAGFNSDAYIAEVFARLGTLGVQGRGQAPQPGRVIMSAHSGGGAPVTQMLRVENQDRVTAHRRRGGAPDRGTPRQARQPRISARLGEVALFDAINDDGQLAIVRTWVVAQLNSDLAAITSRASTAEQLQYLATSMRFLGYHTQTAFYLTRYESLKNSIRVWFDAHRRRLGGKDSPVYQQLWNNYQVIAVGHSNHDRIMGRGNRLEEALNALPPTSASPPTSTAASP